MLDETSAPRTDEEMTESDSSWAAEAEQAELEGLQCGKRPGPRRKPSTCTSLESGLQVGPGFQLRTPVGKGSALET